MSDPARDAVRFGADGLVPVTVQDAVTGDVLMLAFMNDEALRMTLATGRAHYWSRSRKKLWRKGETSGNDQTVEEIRVNCERSSLLLLVRQTGAVCHEGYPTCYYRRLAANGELTVIRERAFDPVAVYGASAASPTEPARREIDRLAEATREQFGAYAFLRDNDLEAVSTTSRRLRQPNGDFRGRIADELRELAGVLGGEHRHSDLESDLCLEASQVIYWVLLEILGKGITWAKLRPDRALATIADQVPPATAARLLCADAGCWAAGDAHSDVAARAHATLALVGQACRSGGVEPETVVASDLEDLRGRPYLAPYFARSGSGAMGGD